MTFNDPQIKQIPLTVFVGVVFALLGFLVGGITAHSSILQRVTALEVEVRNCAALAR